MARMGQNKFRWLIYGVGAVFCAYTLTLQWNIFSTQAQLQFTINAKWLSDSQHRALTIAEHISARKKKALELAVSHEIESCITNKALGMSEQYGLISNLNAIEMLFS